jgi:hypothetical protein
MWQERAGTLAVAESQLLALAAPASSLDASGSTQPSNPTSPTTFTRWLRGWGALAALAIPSAALGTAVVVLLRWPR